MAATLSLDWHELLWYLEGGMCGSHLRWSIYSQFVNDVFPQLNERERECVYAYAKRDLEEKIIYMEEYPRECFMQLLARFNPANQYRVVMRGKDIKQTADNAYLWKGKYYIGWQRYCGEEYIKKIEQKPYRKCMNDRCEMHKQCLRYTDWEEGDKMLDNSLPAAWFCKKCDFLIEKQ